MRPSEDHKASAFIVRCERHVSSPSTARGVAPLFAPLAHAELVACIVTRWPVGAGKGTQTAAEVNSHRFRILRLVRLSRLRCPGGRASNCGGAGESRDHAG